MLRSIATVALFTVVGMGAFAQSGFIGSLPAAKAIPADTVSSADTVSIGAKMPFYVRPDAVISHSTLYNPSGFSWDLNGGGAASLTKVSGAALTSSPVAASGYYSDTIVVATMPGTPGVINLTVREKSNPKFSATSGCDGNLRTLGIAVIGLPALPTIADADTAQGGCTATAPYTVKYSFPAAAKYPLYIQVTIRTYNISGTQIGTPSPKWYKVEKATDNIVISQANLDAAAGGSFTTGRAEVILGNLYDRISLNDSNYTIGATTMTNNLAVDASIVTKAAIMVLPTPSTGIIKHIKTL